MSNIKYRKDIDGLRAFAVLSIIFFFLKLDFGYFGQYSQIIPLRHTWSLIVEKQFYMIWPLILILLFRFQYFF